MIHVHAEVVVSTNSVAVKTKKINDLQGSKACKWVT